ncbi:hypothetical protein O181_050114 [Austropuccinia psidii MF-1]|uniref:Uncharacterized protein n=1 Tax=Austropuccinia psidii MF-1 TaxID=1389203 RepID=A0A9Q3HPD7_9BASI|nr:hypothetical protein [Austropuccinia psidii MF-1]
MKGIESQDTMISSMNSTHNISHMIPIYYKEALKSVKSENWKSEMNEEMFSMNEENVFSIVNINTALKEVSQESTLSTKWVSVKKSRPEKYKARPVAGGLDRFRGSVSMRHLR